ncbi:EamA family transporter [Naumannella halotolerans]|uniref:EamA-like transporter family protein n=1 Tax=Naumannella halotolerans TaxID=993414 RepID=A0A4R7J1F6_9ACTN|nr:DMT family transporter [Naumannella halotolerans]TDT30940.1 EamA-like transporter family protein [Naumannella halotolerans]
MFGLGALGTGIAYVWNFQIVTAWGPALASTVTYLVPIVGIALGVIVLGEKLSWNEPVGAVVVVIGILIAGRRRRPAVSGTAVPETTTTAFPTARVAGTDGADTPGTVDVPTAGTPKPLGCGVGERCAAEQ